MLRLWWENWSGKVGLRKREPAVKPKIVGITEEEKEDIKIVEKLTENMQDWEVDHGKFCLSKIIHKPTGIYLNMFNKRYPVSGGLYVGGSSYDSVELCDKAMNIIYSKHKEHYEKEEKERKRLELQLAMISRNKLKEIVKEVGGE